MAARQGTHTDQWKASHESHHDHDDAHSKGKQAGRDSIAKSLGLKTSKRLDTWEIGVINHACRMSFPCWSPFRAFRCVCTECMEVVFSSREPDFTNHADEDGHTPLMGAAQEGDHEVIQRLLDHGADTDMKTLFGKTAVDIAHDKGRGDCIPLLKRSARQARLARKSGGGMVSSPVELDTGGGGDKSPLPSHSSEQPHGVKFGRRQGGGSDGSKTDSKSQPNLRFIAEEGSSTVITVMMTRSTLITPYQTPD